MTSFLDLLIPVVPLVVIGIASTASIVGCGFKCTLYLPFSRHCDLAVFTELNVKCHHAM